MDKGVIFDLDETLVDTTAATKALKEENWDEALKLIPQFKVYEGIREVLSFIHEHDIKTAVVSTSPKPYCQEVLRHFDISCGCIVGKEDVVDDKPSPEPMLKALENLQLTQPDAVSVGDRAKDIDSAKSAHIITIGSLWGSPESDKLRAAAPDYLVGDPREIIAILKNTFSI